MNTKDWLQKILNGAAKKAKKEELIIGIDPDTYIGKEIIKLSFEICRLRSEIADLRNEIKKVTVVRNDWFKK